MDDEDQLQLPGKLRLQGSFAERFAALDRRENELLQELEKTKGSLLRSRDERDEWRTKYEDTKKEMEIMKSTPSQRDSDLPPQPQRSQRDPNHFYEPTTVYPEDSSNNRSRAHGDTTAESLAEARRRRQREDEEWRKRGQQEAKRSTSPDAPRTKGHEESKVVRKSENFEPTVQLQSVLRAHMSRSETKSPSTIPSKARSTAGGSVVSRPQSSVGGGGSGFGSPSRAGASGRRSPDSDNESTARTQTARSAKLDPISDRSEDGGASSSASGWGDALSSRRDSPLKSIPSRYDDDDHDTDSPFGSPKAKARSKPSKKDLSSESELSESPPKRTGVKRRDVVDNSDSDVTTPRPVRRKNLLPGDDEDVFGF